jgi:hypothetical protein
MNPAKLTFKPLTALPYSNVYILNITLVYGYVNNDISGWKACADSYISQGKKFYMLEQIYNRCKLTRLF